MLHLLLLLPLLAPAAAIGEGFDIDQLTKALLGLGSVFAPSSKTVDVNIDLLMGQWHQMYKSAINFDVFQTSMFCEVAYFRPNAVLRAQGGFEMLEAFRAADKTGPVETYTREILGSDGKYWMTTHEYFYPREWNVVKAGARYNASEGENGTLIGYDYLVVSDSRHISLMVYARDPEEFRQKYIKEVFEFFKEECFGNGCFWNQAEKIYQEPDCAWPSEKEVLVRRALKAHRKQPVVPKESFLENTVKQATNYRQPRVNYPGQAQQAQPNPLAGYNPLSVFQSLFQNIPGIGQVSSLGKK